MQEKRTTESGGAACGFRSALWVLSSPVWRRLWILAACAPFGVPVAGAPPGQSPDAPVDYVIVVTGGELLSGVYPDGHTVFITRTLRPLGLRCVGSMSVDDRKEQIQEALRFAGAKAALVIVTGGLGPTDNDVTRETLSDFSKIPLEEHPDVLARMARRFGSAADRLRANLRRQTRVPVRGTYLENSNGSAVGLVFEMDDRVIVALPGPPRELQAMVRDELVPYLSRRFGTRLPGCSLTLRFVGVGQSQIDATLEKHVPLPPDVTLSSQFEGLRVDFTFSLPDDTPQDRARLEALKQQIVRQLGEYVYGTGETSLEEHVVGLLGARGQMLALAEVGSGGHLAAALSSANGAEDVLAGAFVAPTDQALRGLLGVSDEAWDGAGSNAEKTRLLASAVAERTGSGWAAAVGEALPGESGSRSVEVVFKRPQGDWESQRFPLRGSDTARARLVTQLLDQLRRRLKSKPLPNDGRP